ncbi:MAG TPA: DNA polymerase III subunit epsilon [Candidatus Cybelea sp.]|nr:DNA polymerase III subunit epsilon [Candidatus Cybelea sp.]
MREIVLDTETTGVDAFGGDRLVEIGCIELWNHVPTGKTFQRYLNPERMMPEAAFAVHGLSDAFLSDKPKFAEVADALLEFIGDAPLVIHNAEFDLKFLNVELDRLGKIAIPNGRAVDTVLMARKKFPGAPASLDALCKRFNIDNSNRTLHGALLDAQLLADVYLELLGGRQTGLGLVTEIEVTTSGLDFSGGRAAASGIVLPVRPARPHAASPDELAAHQSFIAKIANAIWLK